MDFEVGMEVVVRGSEEDFTDHLDGQSVTVVDGKPDSAGYIMVKDSKGTTWYVHSTDVRSV